ncbi:hypothetical protein FIBSPDRAFT_953049 [Athelia psychrophila]|uniref:Peptidase M20 domain-containing protein 2 n=1 Tax=Athelia psychrophila TaxID=1759441 RepID=A0A166KSB9_9AGAM|nr:hypothetical protein FIBSPDRAFT_953049 [Fibularhizoctonia sp. CBS 109695]
MTQLSDLEASSSTWQLDDAHDVDALAASLRAQAEHSDVLDAIEICINSSSDKLRKLNLPELKFEEKHAHDVLTEFMEKEGFETDRHYQLPTAWRATYTRGSGGRTIGINSEMDALPGIGHACGHNLIAIAGVAVACAIKSVMEQFDISGRILLLGTPGEEGGFGKDMLFEKGAYDGMDACLMCHPAPGPQSSISLTSSLALIRFDVEYTGHSAHAALSPWEGQNALDAAVLAYTSISTLRQQVKPTHRVHGVFSGNNWTPNIIPDNSQMQWYVRAPTMAEAKETAKRVTACFEAASLASGCKVKVTELEHPAFDLRQNAALGSELTKIVESRYGVIDYEYGIKDASTDFGRISYELPSLHPGFSIPTEDNGGNHTLGFTKAARSLEAHKACLNVSKALAALGVKVLADADFTKKVKESFEEDKKHRGLL